MARRFKGGVLGHNWLKGTDQGILTLSDIYQPLVNKNAPGVPADIFLVGGGGTGGTYNNIMGVYPGGAGGGYAPTYLRKVLEDGVTYTITVAGAGGTSSLVGGSGLYALNLTAAGGSNGVGTGKGGNGGSGGGGAHTNGGEYGGNGGGGANGGTGQGTSTRAFGSTDSSVTPYAGGGAGGTWSTQAFGGDGGGGNGFSLNFSGFVGDPYGDANTGGGGGGVSTYSAGGNPYAWSSGGSGGSGIVIIRYVTAFANNHVGGTITSDSTYTYHTFTSSTNITWSI